MIGYDIPPMCSIPFDNIIDRNINIKKVKKGLEISRKQIKIEEASLKPEIGFFAEYQGSDNKLFMDYGNNSYSLGIQLKYNLFNLLNCE